LTAGSPLPSDEAIAAIVSRVAEKATGTSSVMHDGSTYLLVQPVLGERHPAAFVFMRPTPSGSGRLLKPSGYSLVPTGGPFAN
jgi:hypothetical protein